MGQDIDKASELFKNGEFSALEEYATSSHKAHPDHNNKAITVLDSLVDISSRIRLDFDLSEDEVEKQMKKKIGKYSMTDKQEWEKNKWLEFRIIDGQKLYFNRSVANLMLRLKSIKDEHSGKQPSVDALSEFKLKHTQQAILDTKANGDLVEPVHYTITYTLTVKPDAVPANDLLRCWLPFPKENRLRQSHVKLLETSESKLQLSPDSAGHRTLYMEKKAEAGKPTVFQIKFSYVGAAQYYDLTKSEIHPYNQSTELYRKYTAEQSPHIVFTPKIKDLTDAIVGEEKEPCEIVKKLYDWIDSHIIWSGALEYSTIAEIPEYVLANCKGDCGMQTLLFMTMARYKGIPVKWQSGWMLHLNEVNLHDWCEVYYEGVGWVPLDMSFGLQKTTNEQLKYYYVSGIDAYRFIVNDAISTPLFPEKNFLRSETLDFQRGEVESEHGNLYFDKWNYHMDVAYE